MARASASHIPKYPRGFLILRILQLALNVIILSICSYAVYVAAFSGDCLMLFTSIVTFIVTIWLVCAHTCVPQAYNYWAVLAFDIFLFIFWLISFSLLAAQTAYYWANGSRYCGYYSCYYGSLQDDDLIYGSILAAAAGLGAIEFLFFKISLIIHVIVIVRHRRAGLHSKPTKTEAMPYKLQLQPQTKTNYEAVPQYGLPVGQDTAYHSQQTYNAPASQQGFQQPQVPSQQPGQQTVSPPAYQQQPQQGFYSQQSPAPIVPQHTGGSFVRHTQSPPPVPQGMYEAPSFHPRTSSPAPQGVYEAPSFQPQTSSSPTPQGIYQPPHNQAQY